MSLSGNRNSMWNESSSGQTEQNIIIFADNFIKIGKKKSQIRLLAFANYLVKIKVEYIFLKQQSKTKPKKVLNWSFEVKFEVIKQKVESSETDYYKVIGLKLTVENSDKFLLVGQSEAVLLKWKSFFSQKITQFGFHDQFNVSKKIGNGSFAVVYFGMNKETKQKVAIKALNKETIYKERQGKVLTYLKLSCQMSVIQEIDLMRKLKHGNIIRLLEVQETKNQIFLILEFMEGGSLAERIQSKGKFSQQEVVEIMFGILNGVKYLHRANIMHRDLKLENILFRNKQKLNIAIADFGLANEINSSLLFKKCGTPGYVAPEILQHNASHYNELCDLFSVGVIFHRLQNSQHFIIIFRLTGVAAFQGADGAQTISLNLSAKIDYSAKHFQSAPHHGIDLLKKLLERNPRNRISANDALKHPYFQEMMQEAENEIEEEPAQFEKFQIRQSNFMISCNSGRNFNMHRINKFYLQPVKSHCNPQQSLMQASSLNSALQTSRQETTPRNLPVDQNQKQSLFQEENFKVQPILTRLRGSTEHQTDTQNTNSIAFF